MTTVLELPVSAAGGDGVVLIEIDDDQVTKSERLALGARHASTDVAQRTFADSIDQIRPAIVAVLAKMEAMPRRPDTVCLEFGVKFGAKAVPILVAASAEAHLKLTLTWNREAPS
jgi:hypothetical protein